MQYRRANVAGGTYFFTVNLAERKRTLLVDLIDVLRKAIKNVKTTHPFRIDAMVVLPDHVHAIWALPEGDSDYPTRWALIKASFSRSLPKDEWRHKSRTTKGERACGNDGTGAFDPGMTRIIQGTWIMSITSR